MLQRDNREGLDSFQVAQEVVIAASRAAVWAALTTDIGAWWAFRITGDDAMMTLDARIGGHFAEKRSNGEGAIWGTVTNIRPGRVLRLSGPLGMVGRPLVSVYAYEIEERSSGTLVNLTHHCFGDLDPEWSKQYDEGWKTLLATYLRRYLEDGATWRDIKRDS